MSDPYDINGPALISFSGGRTSGFMLRKICDFGLKPGVHILFANTGREREETLKFVNDCAVNWDLKIHWIEFRRENEAKGNSSSYEEVSYETASRNGEPFAKLIKIRFAPNPVSRFCTQELKIRCMKHWMMDRGYKHWTNVVGIRYDEPRRAARLKQPSKERWDNLVPLYDAEVTEQQVLDFWKTQNFDLQLKSYQGNCDLCFLKSHNKKLQIIKENPELADWWIGQEKLSNSKFRKDYFSYEQLKKLALQPSLFDFLKPDDDDATQGIDCFCGD